ncbi:MAG: transglutaminase family protein [Kineosporiaceae bacterium]
MTTTGTLGTAQRLRIVHRTGYRYEELVGASYNEARITPLTTPTQTALEAKVEISPVTWVHHYWDYWGTQVTAFEVLVPHQELTVVSTSTVENVSTFDEAGGLTWGAIHTDDFRDAHVEFLVPTPASEAPQEVVELARAVTAGLTPDEGALAVCEAIRGEVEYRPGVTGVHTGAGEAWAAKKGVCQDFAHLSLGALRAVGIPARYVSGYLHPFPESEIGETHEGESHAWIEFFTGRWRAFDPTGLRPADADHVIVARGRDYSDVSPLKGVYAGPSGSELFVSVEVTRLA